MDRMKKTKFYVTFYNRKRLDSHYLFVLVIWNFFLNEGKRIFFYLSECVFFSIF
jgi:hypothetical protein